jgi:hypothetical protein
MRTDHRIKARAGTSLGNDPPEHLIQGQPIPWFVLFFTPWAHLLPAATDAHSADHTVFYERSLVTIRREITERDDRPQKKGVVRPGSVNRWHTPQATLPA